MDYTLLLNFVIEDDLIYLSHRQTMTMLWRAMTRTGLDIVYSQGFNPHPRLYLPLPRTVGLSGYDELCYIFLNDKPPCDGRDMTSYLSGALPMGCRLTGAVLRPGRTAFRAESALYAFDVEGLERDTALQNRITELSRQCGKPDTLFVRRHNPDSLQSRRFDAGRFITSIEVDRQTVLFDCISGPDGSVRVDEMMQLLGIDRSALTGPVTRKSVRWVEN